MQIELTQNMIDWYYTVTNTHLKDKHLIDLEYAITKALKRETEAIKKEKPKLPENLCYKLNSPDENMFNSVGAINQLIDYLKAKENEGIIEP